MLSSEQQIIPLRDSKPKTTAEQHSYDPILQVIRHMKRFIADHFKQKNEISSNPAFKVAKWSHKMLNIFKQLSSLGSDAINNDSQTSSELQELNMRVSELLMPMVLLIVESLKNPPSTQPEDKSNSIERQNTNSPRTLQETKESQTEDRQKLLVAKRRKQSKI